jgi:hypothetical protein
MYLGNQPALSYTSFAKQDFTTSATTSYTLDNPVANANELALFINFVRQEPTTAYSASGTSLTLTSATSASDDMYCVFLGKAVQTVNPPNASVGLSQLTATGTKDATTFLRGDNTFAVAGGTNTPAFLAYKNATQGSISGNTATKITYTEELFDTDNNFASSRFTTTVAGKYYVFAFVYIGATIDQNNPEIMFYKNGSAISTEFQVPGATKNMSMSSSTIVELNINDYIEVYAKTYSASSAFASGTSIRFGGYKLIT